MGFTWVRVYGDGSGPVQYQVFPGNRVTTDASPDVAWDRPATDSSGPLDYYAPLRDDSSLGGDFDYPGWIRQHVTW